MASERQLAEITSQLSRLADAQERTADMMESMVYLYAAANDADVEFESASHQSYWTAVPPWEDGE